MEHLQRNIDERGVLTLTLDRAEIHNAFDDALVASLTAALLDAENRGAPLRDRLLRALERVEPTLARHESRFG